MQLDSSVAISIINGFANCRRFFLLQGWSLVREICKITMLPCNIKFVSIYRKADKCADALSSLASCRIEPLNFLEHCPFSMGQLLSG